MAEAAELTLKLLKLGLRNKIICAELSRSRRTEPLTECGEEHGDHFAGHAAGDVWTGAPGDRQKVDGGSPSR